MSIDTNPAALISDLDDALDRFHHAGDEWSIGLTSHGPMVVEALDRVGRADAVAGWTAQYLNRLVPPPEARTTIEADAWRRHLGDGDLAAWTDLVRAELRSDPWTEVVARWVGRLAAGAISAATHGLIRTAHATRGLERAVTPVRIDELARALGYWAARYDALPTTGPDDDAALGGVPLDAALDVVPMVPAEERTDFLISSRMARIDGDRFARAIASVDLPTDPVAGAVAVATLGARILATNPRAEIAFVHAVTAPEAVVALAPHLTPEVAQQSAREAFRCVAALWATYGEVPPGSAAPGAGQLPEWDDLVGRAADLAVDGDEHHIKLAVASRALVAAGGSDDLLRPVAGGVLGVTGAAAARPATR